MKKQDSVHEFAAKGFQVAGDAYERGRPEYPRDAIQFLIEELKLGTGKKVADIGAGTGKFTKLIAQCGAQIVAIEPVEGMRKKFSSLLPEIEVLEGTAERIPLENKSLDAVVVAQAFHWFNGEAALKEIHRVLKSDGRIALIWNARDEKVDWVAKLTEIIDIHEKGAPRYKSGLWKNAFLATNLFSTLKTFTFEYVQTGDLQTMVDRVASISFIASLEPREKAEVLEQVAQLISTHPMTKNRDTIQLPYRTDVFVSNKIG